MRHLWNLCCEYGRFYSKEMLWFWRSLWPTTYNVALAGVWLISFLLLKSGVRRQVGLSRLTWRAIHVF